MVTGHEKKSHLHLIDEPQKFFPLGLNLIFIFGITFD